MSSRQQDLLPLMRQAERALAAERPAPTRRREGKRRSSRAMPAGIADRLLPIQIEEGRQTLALLDQQIADLRRELEQLSDRRVAPSPDRPLIARRQRWLDGLRAERLLTSDGLAELTRKAQAKGLLP